MADTAIEWATRVWNPTTGCDRVSAGCDHCYALTMAKRLKGMGHRKYQRDGDPRTSGPGFAATHHSGVLGDPFKWRKPQRVFVNSMSDLFHDDIPDVFIAHVWKVMKSNPKHTFMVLTKRHARMRSLLSSPDFQEMVFSFGGVGRGQAGAHLSQYRKWPVPNVHLGVSAENQRWADIRIPTLMETPAAVRFISAEPMLGPIKLSHLHSHCPTHDFPGGFCVGYCPDRVLPDWVIVGGESGPRARPMHPNWARGLRDQCTKIGIPFFFKQHGEWAPAPWHGPDGATHAFTGGLYQDDNGDWVENFMALGHSPTSSERDLTTPPGSQGMRRVGKKAAGRELDGRTWDEFPAAVTV
ncbi:phage Gp37/Gp68 family protein [Mycobacterium hackensackense]|uniref:phage Gp37/Gp68 family protein n=1 Tax=Mycobacterium hackensackense TaxID=228909 RepID=UPI002265CDB3|nr:phage Gp37/Gp68 family protein [Mycobacterium hackensackense]